MLATFRVLLVEDDDPFANFIATQLKAASVIASLHRARTLAAALSTIETAPVDAILLDLGLPDSSGLDTLDRVCAAAPHIPIVVLTAHDDDTTAIFAMQRGAQDYLVKGSTDADMLARALRYALERQGLRRAIYEREARFRALLEHSYDAITLIDREGIVLFDSGSVERITGYSPAERFGHRFDELAYEDDRPLIDQQFAHCLRTCADAVSVEYRCRHRDGSWRWVEAVCVNHLDNPAVRAIVVNHRDVTERKLTEEALRNSEEQLRHSHKLEAVGRLAGGVAHDFNNVLTAIFGYSDLLLEQFSDDDPRRSDVEEIRRSAERAAALTRQLLAFSRKQVMQPRVVDLNDVIRGLETLIVRLVREDIRVTISTAPDLWRVRADPGQIEQVLMNLTANARDAMPEGGDLTVETKNVMLGEDPTRPDLPPGDYVALAVSDTGTGVTEGARDHMFEPFFTTKEFGQGTGLGLAMVYGIVKQTGGAIYLESEPGAGARFVMYLPRVTSP